MHVDKGSTPVFKNAVDAVYRTLGIWCFRVPLSRTDTTITSAIDCRTRLRPYADDSTLNACPSIRCLARSWHQNSVIAGLLPEADIHLAFVASISLRT
jgi:hypothetical protein